jgi:hypothetical protein
MPKVKSVSDTQITSNGLRRCTLPCVNYCNFILQELLLNDESK